MMSTNNVVANGVTSEKLINVRKWNIALTILHLGQAIAVLLLTNDFAIKVLSSFPAGPPGTEGLVTSTLFEVRIGWVIAAFLALAGLDHLITSTFARKTYENDLKNGINRFRWAEYSISATLMVVVISMYWGILTLAALVAVVGANFAMILFGWLQEKMNPPGRTSTTMMPFWFGTLAGIAPWLAMLVNISQIPLDDAPAGLVVIQIVQAIFFFCFGLNQWLQYRGIGKWSSYMFGEKTYLILSLGAKSLLAWQIFAVSLIPITN
ncbi:Heliorhodopsin [actinobacterium SCGC AAA044-D11]